MHLKLNCPRITQPTCVAQYTKTQVPWLQEGLHRCSTSIAAVSVWAICLHGKSKPSRVATVIRADTAEDITLV